MRRVLLSLTFLLVMTIANAQTEQEYVKLPISFSQYLKIIEDNNLDLAAEKLNVDISKANIRTARVLPDPELTIEGTDNEEKRMRMGYEIGAALDWTLELGGKRNARVELAKSESELAISLLEDYYRGLRVDATLQFLSSLRNENLYHTHLEAYENMNKIAKADSVRYSAGEISEVSARQSKLEVRRLWNELKDSEFKWIDEMMALEVFINMGMSDTILRPVGDFEKFNRDFMLSDLIITAQNNRSDLLAAYQNREVAQRLIKLEKANRNIDLGLSLKVAHSTYSHNDVAPTPAHTPISVGVTIPLKFSNKNNSDLRVAKFQHQQTEYQYQQIENKILVEVTHAYRHYNSMRMQMEQFDEGILEEAKTILDERISNYSNGSGSLLELMDAQRTYSNIKERYYETLYNTAAALVELEKTVGIWDISF